MYPNQNQIFVGSAGGNSAQGGQKRKNLLIGACIFLFLLVIAAVFVSLRESGTRSGGNSKAADRFVNLVIGSNYSDSFAMLAEQTQANETETGWQAKVKKVEGFFTNLKFVGESENEWNNLMSYTYTATGKDGEYKILVGVVGDKIMTFETYLQSPGTSQ